ncbi:hypothetical protein OWK27_03640 [Enterobacter cloacae complex sp. 2022EL-00788]|uniref:hypothetical protein n=1 Tax=Enterobacter cloacae complex sp. 2022EL-00788 TaxID=2996512 RepID=UPI00227064FE|nr:hypothetical protein [Enterobacter cloacae complex sp. 2022EL-00788]MCY0771809.1 hypothetical protein [Enterobacter cloacae complex sp. 2022EL-00788]
MLDNLKNKILTKKQKKCLEIAILNFPFNWCKSCNVSDTIIFDNPDPWIAGVVDRCRVEDVVYYSNKVKANFCFIVEDDFDNYATFMVPICFEYNAGSINVSINNKVNMILHESTMYDIAKEIILSAEDN